MQVLTIPRPEIRYHETYSFETNVPDTGLRSIYRQTMARLHSSRKGILLEIAGAASDDSIFANVNLYEGCVDDRLPRFFRLLGIRLSVDGDFRTTPLPWENASFDTVICVDAFYRIKNPLNALRDIHRLLGSNGRLVLADHWFRYRTPNTGNLLQSYKRTEGRRIYSERTVVRLLRQAGFCCIESEPVGSNGFIVTASTC